MSLPVAQLIRYLHPDSESGNDWIVERKDGEAKITEWNLSVAQPTSEELESTFNSQGFRDFKAIMDDPASRKLYKLKKKLRNDDHRLLRAVVAMVVKQINLLRARHGEPPITKAEVLSLIDAEL